MIFGIDDTVLPNEPHDTDLTYTMALKIYRKCADVYCMRNSVGKEMYCMHLQVKNRVEYGTTLISAWYYFQVYKTVNKTTKIYVL